MIARTRTHASCSRSFGRYLRALIPTIRNRLLQEFPEPRADLLTRVFVESHDELVTKAAFNELTGVVRGTVAGKPVTVFCEAQASVSPAEVQRFLRVVEKTKAAHPDDDVRPLFFSSKADPKARELIILHGAAMVFTRGVMIPRADAAA